MNSAAHTISGRIYIFHAFDVGEEIDLAAVADHKQLQTLKRPLPKYFKNYHIPLSVALPQHDTGTNMIACDAAQLHNFGVISLRYVRPFKCTIEELRAQLIASDDASLAQSALDAQQIFNTIQSHIVQAKFYHIHRTYALIQIDDLPANLDVTSLRAQYGSTIASLLRFETETLSAHEQNEIWNDAFSYYHKDLIIVDTHATLLCDEEYEEVLDLFEFANVQNVELQYFDRILDKQLNTAYEHERRQNPWTVYLPFVGSNQISDLNKVKVDISVITDRIETSIKLAGEEYVSKLYDALSLQLDLPSWRESINRKLGIIQDISSIYQHDLEMVRQDMFSSLIIILITLELAFDIYTLLMK